MTRSAVSGAQKHLDCGLQELRRDVATSTNRPFFSHARKETARFFSRSQKSLTETSETSETGRLTAALSMGAALSTGAALVLPLSWVLPWAWAGEARLPWALSCVALLRFVGRSEIIFLLFDRGSSGGLGLFLLPGGLPLGLGAGCFIGFFLIGNIFIGGGLDVIQKQHKRQGRAPQSDNLPFQVCQVSRKRRVTGRSI